MTVIHGVDNHYDDGNSDSDGDVNELLFISLLFLSIPPM